MTYSFKSKKVVKKIKRYNKDKSFKILKHKSKKSLRILKNLKFLFYRSFFKHNKKNKNFIFNKYKKFIKVFYNYSVARKSFFLTNDTSNINLLVRKREENLNDTSYILDKKSKNSFLLFESKHDKLIDEFSLELKQILDNFAFFLLTRDYAKYSKQNLFLSQTQRLKTNPLKMIDSFLHLKDFVDTLKVINKFYNNIKEQRKIFFKSDLSKKYNYKPAMSRQSLKTDLKRLDFDAKFSWFPYHFVFNLRLSPNNIFCHLTDNDGMTVFPVRNGAYYNLKTSKWTVRNNLVSVFNAYWDEIILAYQEGKVQQLFPNHIVFKIHGIKKHRKDVLAYIKNDCIPKLRTFMNTYNHIPYIKTKEHSFEYEILKENVNKNIDTEILNYNESNISTEINGNNNNIASEQTINQDTFNNDNHNLETSTQVYFKSLGLSDTSEVDLENWPINRSLNFTIEIVNEKPFNGCRVKKEKRVRRFKSKFVKVRRG